jgi:hypothetical protein
MRGTVNRDTWCHARNKHHSSLLLFIRIGWVGLTQDDKYSCSVPNHIVNEYIPLVLNSGYICRPLDKLRNPMSLLLLISSVSELVVGHGTQAAPTTLPVMMTAFASVKFAMSSLVALASSDESAFPICSAVSKASKHCRR